MDSRGDHFHSTLCNSMQFHDDRGVCINSGFNVESLKLLVRGSPCITKINYEMKIYMYKNVNTDKIYSIK
jgi:hypothetical protein